MDEKVYARGEEKAIAAIGSIDFAKTSPEAFDFLAETTLFDLWENFVAFFENYPPAQPLSFWPELQAMRRTFTVLSSLDA